MLVFYKLIHGLMRIDNHFLPPPTSVNSQRETRSSDPDHLSFTTTTRNKTTTFQKSYLNRCTRMWNVLPKNLTGNNTSLSQFKNGLFMYYKVALETVYVVDDPRTWKSICLSCKKSCNLSCKVLCCY